MGTLYRSPSTNFWSTTLNGAINDTVQTITLNSTTGLRAPGVLIIDRQDSSGNNTPSAREVISFTGVSGSDLTGVTRAFSGSTARSHSTGALIEATMETGMWDNMVSAATVVFTADGVLNSVLSPMSISRAQITQMALSSVASITNLQATNMALSGTASLTEVQGARGIFSTMTISTLLSASGASIVGISSTADPLTIGNLILTAGASIASLKVGTYLSNSGASLTLYTNVDSGVEDFMFGAVNLGGEWGIHLPVRFGIPFPTTPTIVISVVSAPSVISPTAINKHQRGFSLQIDSSNTQNAPMYGVISWRATG